MIMKSSLSFRQRHSGFTLIELLVVITIIIILAAIILSVASLAFKTAQRAKVNQLATSIQTAAINYYTEYGVLPVPANTTTDYTITDSGEAAWGQLLIALSGNINPSTGVAATSTVPNTRAISFLTLKSTDVDSVGAPKNPLPSNTGTSLYFNIGMDSDYDGIVGISPSAVTTLPNFTAATSNSLPLTGGVCTGAGNVAIWVNCTGKATTTSPMTCNPAFWVHTY
jgi:prepilin-type N-terminal cleavage/methylation domain-containing protein